jgi:TATA-box binding protein (TBP) (component of TFIID and TFIIIB)
MEARNFRTFLGNIIKAHDEIQGPKPTLPRVSTMTVMGGRDGIVTPLATFKEKFADGTGGWNMGSNHFNNSLTLSKDVGETKKRSVKLFPNGKIHVTGSSTPMEGLDIIQDIQKIVDEVFPETTNSPVSPMETQMINATFRLPHGIDQLALLELYKKHQKYVKKVSLNPETYSAVKAKMFNMTVSVFKTGSIVMSGAKNFKDIAMAYRFLISVLYDPQVKGNAIDIKLKNDILVHQCERFHQRIRDFYLLNK